jgi:glycosyltransferase involved in cell wall biosynthesis
MKNEIEGNHSNEDVTRYEELFGLGNSVFPEITQKINRLNSFPDHTNDMAEILFITTYPPRECGIATYSQDLINALNNKFRNSFTVKVCALESNGITYPYPGEVKYILKTSLNKDYEKLAFRINRDNKIKIVLIQHEFGFFHNQEEAFLNFLHELSKPVIIVFHTILPDPDERLKVKLQNITAACKSIIVMTNASADILKKVYDIPQNKISVIAHGTHLVPHLSEKFLKGKYGLKDRKVLTTFGLLSSGKGIETTLEALPAIIKTNPDVIFLLIGKTHPEVVKTEGEKYRGMLEQQVKQYSLQDNVRFINSYLPLPDLLEYLQLSDIYLFTANDPNQAVSGTFVYAMSCACPIISTPIPHAKEVLTEDTGIIFDFRNSQQLADSVIRLLNDKPLRRNLSSNTLEKIVSTVWENSAVAHARLFEEFSGGKIQLNYTHPEINLDHLHKMTTPAGIIQFSKINQPDICSGYTLDDNARALVATCMYFKLTGKSEIIPDIYKYLGFIKHCQQPAGDFLNYTDEENRFTSQNTTSNLDDSNGRAVWALGYLVSLKELLPAEIISVAIAIIDKTLLRIDSVHSTRAMAFAIKGLYYYHIARKSPENIVLIQTLANRLVQMFKHESNNKWEWFEGYLTYANSILPEAMLYAWLLTRETIYKEIAISSLHFLLSQTFNDNGIEVISSKSWLHKGQVAGHFGEQPIDVSYTIMTLSKFYDVFMDPDYRLKMETAFNWFLGNNRLHQIIYNPCTGGCYDGLEETHVNLNQGAESTVSYLMARLTMEEYNSKENPIMDHSRHHFSVHTKQRQFIYSSNNKQSTV